MTNAGTQSVLTSESVEALFAACSFNDGDDDSDRVEVESIAKGTFRRGRLQEFEDDIKQLLDELPDAFKASGGGGMSFLQACEDRHGNQWTGFHAMMDMLFQLGIAIDRVTIGITEGNGIIPLPREVWGSLPGGMPYFLVQDD